MGGFGELLQFPQRFDCDAGGDHAQSTARVCEKTLAARLPGTIAGGASRISRRTLDLHTPIVRGGARGLPGLTPVQNALKQTGSW